MNPRREKDRQPGRDGSPAARTVLLAAPALCATLPAQPALTLPLALRQAQAASLQAGQAERARQTAVPEKPERILQP